MLNWIYKYILPTIGWFLMKLWTRTVKLEVVGEAQVDALRQKGQKIVYVFWHARQFLLEEFMSKKHICILASPSRDGQLQASMLSKFGYSTVLGSSHKSPVRALVGMIAKMRDGWDAGIAVDGPKGPIYKSKPGAIFLAKKTDAVIIPITFSSNRYKIFDKSWDHFLLPMPFSKGKLIIGDPIRLSPDLDDSVIESDCATVDQALNAITQEADLLMNQ